MSIVQLGTRALLTAALVLTGLVVAVGQAPVAHAAGGSVRAGNGVLWSDCRYYPARVRVNVPSASNGWFADLELRGPDGRTSRSDYLHGDYDGTYSARFFLCGGSDRPGRYRINVVDAAYYDQDYVEVPLAIAGDTFSLRRPKSRTSITVSDNTPRFNQVMTFRSTTRDERPRGFFPTSYATVRLQYRTKSGWITARSGRGFTNDRGRATWKYRWNTRRTFRVRVLTVADDYASSASRVVTIDVRRGRIAVSHHRRLPGIE